MEGHKITITVSPFTGFSGTYTEDVIGRIEEVVREYLDEMVGYLNDKNERNYEIVREDWNGQLQDYPFSVPR